MGIEVLVGMQNLKRVSAKATQVRAESNHEEFDCSHNAETSRDIFHKVAAHG